MMELMKYVAQVTLPASRDDIVHNGPLVRKES